MATVTKLGAIQPGGATAESATVGPCFQERHYSPAELAEQWNLSEDTVRRIFEREQGVLIFENPERISSRRRRTMRIPESVAQRAYRRMTLKQNGGH